MTTVTLQVTTVQEAFPQGTSDTPYVFTVTDPTGVVVVTQSESIPSAVVTVANPGNYIATVVKNGVAASAAFTIVAPTVSLNVPSAITVALS